MKTTMASRNVLLLRLFLFAVFFSAAALADDTDCVYTLYVRTGKIAEGGTNSVISASLYDAAGKRVEIRDLEAWGGLMRQGHDYFQRGNLDVFSGRGTCLGSRVCGLQLTSDGSGDFSNWYVEYVEVTASGVHAECSNLRFEFGQWLTAPYQLTATRDSCGLSGSGSGSRLRKTRLSSIV